MIYVGKACGRNVTNGYLGSGTYLKRAINVYGKENFRRVTIDVAKNKAEQNQKEIRWISFYDSRNPSVGYNIAKGGDSGFTDCHHSEESKRKTGMSLVGNKNSLGRAPWNKGIKCPDVSARMMGENNPMFGKKMPKHSVRMTGQNNPMSRTNKALRQGASR
jgi:hypothetical protein